MTAVSTLLLALAMSTDAFAAAIVKGSELRRPQWRDALRTGAIFGVIEAITPVVGWALGLGAASYIQAWDHWIAFALLAILGGRTIYAGLSGQPDHLPRKPAQHGFWTLAATGFATSIDAMAVGVSLAFLDVPIVPVAVCIGLATFVMVTLGVMLGRVMGLVVGRRAEIVGGLVLLGIGCAILYEHLMVLD
ncbi:putative Mn2+ efflux pump MntP [Comamonas sp. BIGb0124]|uniref:manganese efflux pump MntP n=1 Tax=Comamonas sp. BIGb0124 TaxID=2485130 RepID=UPI000F469061|nr:manganese efflux pump MntP family protein [Comamonas sp. BIGb0124]ROR26551.1 putative Mn2+ efflux pump MntP [Comamonas sp. BIGb0124]